MTPKLSLAALAALVLVACATNPVTGGREFSLMSEAQEIEMGRQMDPEVRAEMGLYPDEALQQYVQDVGMRLARTSERPDLPWHFAVVDVPAVNAFALPGGYIYITRGLLAHLDSEAEMAGVLGHDAMMVLELVPNAQGASLEAIAAASMQKAGFTPLSGENTRLNGIPAFEGVYDGLTQDGAAVRVRAAHIRHEQKVFLLAGIAGQSGYAQAEPSFADTIRSFAPLNAAEAARINPNRLGFSTVRAGDAWARIAERTGGLISASDLAVLNGSAAGSQPPAGQRIKIVIADD